MFQYGYTAMTIWEIVGGGKDGGILVREGQATSSPLKVLRLAKGATVEQIALQGERLHFRRLTGEGPDDGWISLKFKDKALARRLDVDTQAAGADGDTRMPSTLQMGTWQSLTASDFAKLPKYEDNDKLRPKTMAQFKKVVNTDEPGEYHGIKFPYSPDALREAGPEWLTMAMHTAGTMPRENAVTKITCFKVFAEDTTKQDLENAKFGGAGLKVLMTVEYKNGPSETLTEGMFVKMPHAFTGKNERFKNSVTNLGLMDWSEVTFYNIFGGSYGHVPFKVPRMYFCDMSRKTTNFVNIVERIPYGQGNYFPAPDKYRDWDLPNNGINLYYAHAGALARFFGWHKNIREVTDQVESIFMDEARKKITYELLEQTNKEGKYLSKERDIAFKKRLQDPGTQAMVATLSFPPATAKGFLEIFVEFVNNTAKHVFPPELVEKAYLDKFFKDAMEMSKYCCEMTYYSFAIPEYFSFVHPNAQVDNAYYWKNDSDGVDCGLLDWGGVSHGSIPTCIGSGWIGAEPETFDEHEPKILQYFIDEYEKATGIKFDFTDLYMHAKLAQAVVIPGCSANLGMLLRIISKPDWKNVKDRFDPQIDHNFLARCYYVQVEMLLAMWKKRSPYNHFKDWLKKTQIPVK